MASIRTALRLAPRAQFVRPTATSRILPIAQQQRSFMFISRPAEPDRKAEEVEQGQEDLYGGNVDPNMVCNTAR